MYAASTIQNLYLKMELQNLQQHSDERLQIVHVLSNEKNKNKNKDLVWGRINKDLIQQSTTVVSKNDDKNRDTQIWVCGPPSFYNTICGPRDEKEISGILNELGFSEKHVIKF